MPLQHRHQHCHAVAIARTVEFFGLADEVWPPVLGIEPYETRRFIELPQAARDIHVLGTGKQLRAEKIRNRDVELREFIVGLLGEARDLFARSLPRVAGAVSCATGAQLVW